MKTAIVCDWLVTIGGAEKFLGHLINCFPESDVYAVIDFIPEEKRDFLQGKKIKTTFLQKLPLVKKYYRHFLPIMPLAIEQLNLSGYDLVISSSHAVAKGVITGPDQLHISYVHSPMRYIWDLQHQYLQETGLDKKSIGLLARYFLHKLRMWDTRSANGVDYFLANSNYIARRIQKAYRRPVDVLYPPIQSDRFCPSGMKEDFYLTASRLVPYKCINLIVEAFNDMPDKKLVVIGDGPDFSKIKKMAKSNVSVLGYQKDKVLLQYLQRAKAFVFAAEEDFGLLPIEAQACGTPVIAFGKGGALETVRGLDQEHPTGVFFLQQTPNHLQQSVINFEKNLEHISVQNCLDNAARFHPVQFKTQILSFVQEKMELLRETQRT